MNDEGATGKGPRFPNVHVWSAAGIVLSALGLGFGIVIPAQRELSEKVGGVVTSAADLDKSIQGLESRVSVMDDRLENMRRDANEGTRELREKLTRLETKFELCVSCSVVSLPPQR